MMEEVKTRVTPSAFAHQLPPQPKNPRNAPITAVTVVNAVLNAPTAVPVLYTVTPSTTTTPFALSASPLFRVLTTCIPSVPSPPIHTFLALTAIGVAITYPRGKSSARHMGSPPTPEKGTHGSDEEEDDESEEEPESTAPFARRTISAEISCAVRSARGGTL